MDFPEKGAQARSSHARPSTNSAKPGDKPGAPLPKPPAPSKCSFPRPRPVDEVPARLSRRDPRPAAGVGSRGPAGQVAQAGPGMGGVVALQCREDAVLLRQRPERVLPRFLVG